MNVLLPDLIKDLDQKNQDEWKEAISSATAAEGCHMALEIVVRGSLFMKLYECISSSSDPTEIELCNALQNADIAKQKMGIYTLLDEDQTLNMIWCEYAAYATNKGNEYYLPPDALVFVAQMTGIKICLHKPYSSIEPDVIYEPQEGGRTCHLGNLPLEHVYPLVLGLGDSKSTQHITHTGGRHYVRLGQPSTAHRDF
jgi:hypothetical protein